MHAYDGTKRRHEGDRRPRDRSASAHFLATNVRALPAIVLTIRVEAAGNERERIVYTLNAIGGKTHESYEECTTPASACSTWVSRRSDSFSYDAAGRVTTTTHPEQ